MREGGRGVEGATAAAASTLQGSSFAGHHRGGLVQEETPIVVLVLLVHLFTDVVVGDLKAQEALTAFFGGAAERFAILQLAARALSVEVAAGGAAGVAQAARAGLVSDLFFIVGVYHPRSAFAVFQVVKGSIFFNSAEATLVVVVENAAALLRGCTHAVVVGIELDRVEDLDELPLGRARPLLHESGPL